MTEAITTPAETYVDEQDGTITERWRIEDLPTMDWALSRIADLEAEISENEEMAERAIAAIRARVDKLNTKAMRGADFFRSRVLEFAKAQKETLLKGGKKKSRETPHGRVAFRSKGGGLKVEDEAALLAWARAQPVELGLVRIKEEPALAAIKQYADEKGLIPPGMTETKPTEEIEVHVSGLELRRK